MVLVDGMHFSARFRPTPLWVAFASQMTWFSNRKFAHGKLTQTYICCNVCVNLSCVCGSIKFIAATLPTSAATIIPIIVAAIDPLGFSLRPS